MHCILTGAPGEFWLTTSSVFGMVEDSYATASVPNFWECVNSDGAVISVRLRREASKCFDGFGDQYVCYRGNQSFFFIFRSATLG